MNEAINRLAGRAAAALLLTSSVAAPAGAGPLPDGGITREEVVAVLKDQGLTGKITDGQDGNRRVDSLFEGTKFGVYFFDCDRSRCASIQFSAGFSKKGVAPQRILDWNRDKRFGRAYLDKVADPWIEMDMDVEHGATTEAIANDLERWKAIIQEFRTYIGFKG
jgi:hypothetical protein